MIHSALMVTKVSFAVWRRPKLECVLSSNWLLFFVGGLVVIVFFREMNDFQS